MEVLNPLSRYLALLEETLCLKWIEYLWCCCFSFKHFPSPQKPFFLLRLKEWYETFVMKLLAYL